MHIHRNFFPALTPCSPLHYCQKLNAREQSIPVHRYPCQKKVHILHGAWGVKFFRWMAWIVPEPGVEAGVDAPLSVVLGMHPVAATSRSQPYDWFIELPCETLSSPSLASLCRILDEQYCMTRIRCMRGRRRPVGGLSTVRITIQR